MTRVSNARRNVAKSPPAKPVAPADERSGLFGGPDGSSISALPKHIPLPEIPSDGELAFELFCLLFSVILHGSQYLNLYRTVWWLPHSHNDQALNYYLMDFHVMAFSFIVMSRRFPVAVLKLLLWYVLPSRWYQGAVSTCRSCLLSVVALALLWCTYNICLHHGALSVIALAYPTVIYVALFGPALEPVTELFPGNRRCDRPSGPHGGSAAAAASPAAGGGRSAQRSASHACSGSPADVRAEVGALRRDFNERLKRAFFCALLVAYYAVFLPCCFLQSEFYFDLQWAVQQGLFAWCGALTLHACFCFPPRYLDTLHRAALHLGRWRRLEARNVHAPHHIWSENIVWPQNNLVKHNREYFKAEGISNAAEPGCAPHSRFYALFYNPMLVFGMLLGTQAIQVTCQFCALIRSTEWNHLFTLVNLIMLNCVTLFKLMRQYLIMEKIYHAERILQERLGG